MSGRNSIGTTIYRYGYQGQFSEMDNETGLNSFELRPYDSKLGRWLIPDPMHQHHSPYMAMGNNFTGIVDPTGGLDFEFEGPGKSLASIPPTDIKYPSSSTISPWEVDWEWLTGKGPVNRDFTNGDAFTELLQQHSHVQETRDIIVDNLQGYKEGSPLPSGKNPYKLGGIQGIPKYINDYSTLMTGGATGNLAATYLGSYTLKWEVVAIRGNLADVRFSVFNKSTIESATHPPVVGYTDWWRNNIGSPLNDFFSSGPMSMKSQTFNWTETIQWK